jgi:hypothetical protein
MKERGDEMDGDGRLARPALLVTNDNYASLRHTITPSAKVRNWAAKGAAGSTLSAASAKDRFP